MQPIALAQWAHDIRNTLGTLVLHLELLERPSEPDTVRIVNRSYALVKKAAGMCSDLMREADQAETSVRRRKFDVVQTIGEVFDLIAPAVPEPTTLSIATCGPMYAIANPEDVFRILFNLIHNAVSVARTTGGMRRIDLSLEQSATTITIRISDDGPGLPEPVKAQLFRRGRSTTGSTGYGLSIARELAERNGTVLELSESIHGTEFTIELQRIERKVVPTSVAERRLPT